MFSTCDGPGVNSIGVSLTGLSRGPHLSLRRLDEGREPKHCAISRPTARVERGDDSVSALRVLVWGPSRALTTLLKAAHGGEPSSILYINHTPKSTPSSRTSSCRGLPSVRVRAASDRADGVATPLPHSSSTRLCSHGTDGKRCSLALETWHVPHFFPIAAPAPPSIGALCANDHGCRPRLPTSDSSPGSTGSTTFVFVPAEAGSP